MKIRIFTLVMLFSIVFGLSACASYERTTGVDNTWRSKDVPVFEIGVTTQADVIKALGPPSQIITLKEKPVFYYLHEHRKGGGVFLLIFNYANDKAVYDRAVFFFDAEGVMEDFSFSKESVPYEPESE
ncbi:hypothetical protein SAMN05660337_0594 [Maridesulfovibrio ferrireducens]|uniref:Outer membrane protein assembly factor BamE, lipoprotein component of the BamABCDE complex n=1 Tax=Maridesulfovibrio ferrireducens TaxID=246191 RepID=A0A1G9CAA6_9BACT|nr:hypothetical protein [Maridesulfovibrio ferrireducens]SDK48305.1 hypothetical protein SAMN05660337_0594 [Maridesulfovibrio ferrireducens]